ncbi:MAG: hypothetical protein D3908_16785, partial [Candidatus Electrothrix sp. AUS4]|nr:hypothetical protein [Candidatus Electrothrix sp. AUS4]
MSSAKKHGVVKNIATFLTNFFPPRRESASPEKYDQDQQEVQAAEGKNKPSSQGTSRQKKNSPAVSFGPSLGADLDDMDQWFPSSSEEPRKPDEAEPPQEQ